MNTDFGYKHLIGLAWLFPIIIALLVLTLLIKKKSKLGESFDRAVIRYAACFMWALEIIKTVRMINHDDFGPIGYYPLWMAPFHICSMALYAFPIIGSKHPGKLAKWITPFSFAIPLIMTSILLAIPASSGILGSVENWSFCFDNILPYQSWLYHGSLVFVPLYMVLSGFYRPRWRDIFKSTTVLLIVAALAQALNYLFEGSGADFMTLRYGNGNPFAFLLANNPAMYYLLLAGVAIVGETLVIGMVIGIRATCKKRTSEDLED